MNEALANTESRAGATAKRKKRGERAEQEYVMQTPLKVFKVLEVLEGASFKPTNINDVAKATGYPQSFCRNALLTLKEAGYAKRTLDGWIIGPKLARFASGITALNSAMAE